MFMDYEALKVVFVSGLKSLQNLEFNIYNPLFWSIIFLLFLVLCKIWLAKRAFSFSLMAALILLLMTEIEYRWLTVFTKAGEPFDPSIIRLVAFIYITIIFLVYTFLK